MARIIVIEDEERIANLLRRGLEESGHAVTLAFDVASGLRTYMKYHFDMVISDVILPNGSGFDLCRSIRSQNPQIPILMLTALGTTDNKLQGFDSGADDYMVKPFDLRELDARIKVLLRRHPNHTKENTEELLYADLKINIRIKSVFRNSYRINLTPKEYNLLLFFINNTDRVLSRSEIAENVWGTKFDTGTNFVDVYINYLRKKIDKDFEIKLIHTKPGMGYIFAANYEDTY
ncbi:response regulator transcription factor [Bacteroides thetaiotaomicron]|jgi:hypothetical protein|uniref:response regulator transcription factor n=1 Tax=Bacteroides thetaiotaomicron TaxID=818 RepID=UPI00189F176A|nr:response regulator transcription factor [Bacteroides thetaiotaomicron]MDC2175208.1 response regulator transcription factor [Bacteroides thetaiotaomicron]MDC2190796.1 response regulator transcription factor [Bacteroides thetaiotaomicron]